MTVLIEVYKIVPNGDAEELFRGAVPGVRGRGVPQVGNVIAQGGWWKVVHVDLFAAHVDSMAGRAIARGEPREGPDARIFIEPYEGGYFL